MPAPYWVDQNSRYPRCVDGRPVGAIVARQCGRWMVMRRGAAAQRDLGPQFPGASLLFVRLLSELAGVDVRRAFDLTERASSRAGLRCVFHVDDSGLIRRNDYTAQVVGSWAAAAHDVDAYEEADGLLIARRRRVRPRARSGHARPGPMLVWIDVVAARVEPRGSA